MSWGLIQNNLNVDVDSYKSFYKKLKVYYYSWLKIKLFFYSKEAIL